MFVCSPCQPAAAVTFQTRRKTKENYFEQNVWCATLRTVRCVHSFLYDPSGNLCGLKLFLNICFKCCDIWQAMPKLINKITFTQTEIKHIFSTFHFFANEQQRYNTTFSIYVSVVRHTGNLPLHKKSLRFKNLGAKSGKLSNFMKTLYTNSDFVLC